LSVSISCRIAVSRAPAVSSSMEPFSNAWW
jgi:hypothetical protein